MDHTAEVPRLSLIDIKLGNEISKVYLSTEMDGRDRRLIVSLHGNHVTDVQADDVDHVWMDHEIDGPLRKVSSARAIEEMVRLRALERMLTGAQRGR